MTTTEVLIFARVRRGLEYYYETIFVPSITQARKLKRKLQRRKTRPEYRVELVRLVITKTETNL